MLVILWWYLLLSLLAVPLLTLLHNLFFYLITSTIWCGTHNRAGLQIKCVFTGNPPSPGTVDYTTGVYVPCSFRTVVYVLLRPTRKNQWKCCERGPTVFHPYPGRLESVTVYRCHYKDSTFSSVILRPRVLVRSGFEPTYSRSADRRSPKWANRAAVNRGCPSPRRLYSGKRFLQPSIRSISPKVTSKCVIEACTFGTTDIHLVHLVQPGTVKSSPCFKFSRYTGYTCIYDIIFCNMFYCSL